MLLRNWVFFLLSDTWTYLTIQLLVTESHWERKHFLFSFSIGVTNAGKKWPEENFMLQFSIKKLNLWKDPIVALTNQPGNPNSPFLCFWLLRAFFNCETKKIWEKVWRGKLLWKQHRKKPCTIYTVCKEIYELFWNKIRQYYILNNWNTFRKLFSWVPVRVAIYSWTCIVKLRDMWHKLLEKERNEMISSKKWKVS